MSTELAPAAEPIDQLYGAVMNIPCTKTLSHFVVQSELQAYKIGHRDARHAAADLVAQFSAAAADAPPEPAELVLRFGDGLIEVGQGHHGNGRVPAILFGRNGAGTVGVETEGDRVMLPGECIAALTFDNSESLDVVMEKLAELRARIWPDRSAPA